MLKKLCTFAFLATTASAMALAGPGGTKGKPDKGGGGDGGGQLELGFQLQKGFTHSLFLSDNGGNSRQRVYRTSNGMVFYGFAARGVDLALYTTPDGLEVRAFNVTGGQVTSSTPIALVPNSRRQNCATISPDGLQVVYAINQQPELRRYSLADGTTEILYTAGAGEEISGCDHGKDAIIFSVRSDSGDALGSNINRPMKLNDGVASPAGAPFVGGWVIAMDLSPVDDRILVEVRDVGGEIYLIEPDGSWSFIREGREARFDCTGERQIYTNDLDGSSSVFIVEKTGQQRNITGKDIAYGGHFYC